MKYKSFLFFLKQLVMFVVCWGDLLLLLFIIIIMMMVCSIMIQLSIRSPFSRCKSDAKTSPTHLSTRVPLFAEMFANQHCKQVQRYHTYRLQSLLNVKAIIQVFCFLSCTVHTFLVVKINKNMSYKAVGCTTQKICLSILKPRK